MPLVNQTTAAVARVRIVGSLHGSIVYNVLNFGTPDQVNDGDYTDLLTQLATAVIDCVRSTLLPAVSSDYRLLKVTSQIVSTPKSDEHIQEALGTDVGALGAGDVSFVAGVMSIKTGRGGRSFRGRTFIAGIPEGGIEQSRLTPGQLTLLIAFAACLAGKFVGGQATNTWVLGVLSTVRNKVKLTSITAGFTPASQLVVTSQVGSMNSRKLGRGI